MRPKDVLELNKWQLETVCEQLYEILEAESGRGSGVKE